jgi:hypothetical protein
VLARLVNLWPNNRLDELLLWGLGQEPPPGKTRRLNRHQPQRFNAKTKNQSQSKGAGAPITPHQASLFKNKHWMRCAQSTHHRYLVAHRKSRRERKANRMRELLRQCWIRFLQTMNRSSYGWITAAAGSRNGMDRRRLRQSPRNKRIGAAMKTEELAAITMPNTIGFAKLSTALPPQIAMGSIARNAVTEV